MKDENKNNDLDIVIVIGDKVQKKNIIIPKTQSEKDEEKK